MQPYSIDMAIPHAARIVPKSHTRRVKPTLPADFTMDPGVANMPLPITRDTTRMYALVQVRFFPGLEPGRLSGNSVEISTRGSPSDNGCGLLFWLGEDSKGCRSLCSMMLTRWLFVWHLLYHPPWREV